MHTLFFKKGVYLKARERENSTLIHLYHPLPKSKQEEKILCIYFLLMNGKLVWYMYILLCTYGCYLQNKNGYPKDNSIFYIIMGLIVTEVYSLPTQFLLQRPMELC